MLLDCKSTVDAATFLFVGIELLQEPQQASQVKSAVR